MSNALLIASSFAGLGIAAGLFYCGSALWEGILNMDSNALAGQIATGTPIDISQVRALETRLLTALTAAQDRETKKDAAFKSYVSGLANQISDLNSKYEAAISAAGTGTPVPPADYTADYNNLLLSLQTAEALGLGTVADFKPPAAITVAAAGNQAPGSIIGATEAADAADAAKAQADAPPHPATEPAANTGTVVVQAEPAANTGTVVVQAEPAANTGTVVAAPPTPEDTQKAAGDTQAASVVNGGQSGGPGNPAA